MLKIGDKVQIIKLPEEIFKYYYDINKTFSGNIDYTFKTYLDFLESRTHEIGKFDTILKFSYSNYFIGLKTYNNHYFYPEELIKIPYRKIIEKIIEEVKW